MWWRRRLRRCPAKLSIVPIPFERWAARWTIPVLACFCRKPFVARRNRSWIRSTHKWFTNRWCRPGAITDISTRNCLPLECCSPPTGESPAVAIGHHGTLTGVIMISACRGTATPRTGWVASDRFAPDRAGFADACAGVTHGNLLAEWEHTAPRLALEGAALLLKDPARRVPDLVIGAFVARLLEKFADHQPAAARGEELLALIRVAQGDVSRADLIAYADTLASLRQCLVLAATKRKPGREALYEELVGRPSWLTLFESIVDSMMRLHQISDGGQAPNQADVRRAIERVALGCRDAYTEQMATLRGRVMSGIGELATRPAHPRADENELERRFRQTAQLLGTSGWENARPYNAGVLAAAMGGW